ncbi:hypothetical protein MMC21_006755 [Puttea exsequens]|nr:hypothetical protein [Puttea exsequens]
MRPLKFRPTVLVGFTILTLFYFSYKTYPWQKPDQPNVAYIGTHVALDPAGDHGFLPLLEAKDFCLRRRWNAYATRDRRRKVYDLFLINTELDWAEIRFEELKDEVDYFVVLESPRTFQETPKPLHFKEYISSFQNYQSKIIHHVVNFSHGKLEKGDTWGQEHFTRNALLDQALASLQGEQAPSEGDVLIIGDVDEIPRPNVVRALRNCAFPPRVTLMSQFYYYSFQWLNRNPQWPHPQATYYAGPDNTIKPEDLRNNKYATYFKLYNAAWHCSSCFSTLAGLKNKIASFSHKAYNHPYILNSTKLVEKIRWGEDLFERKEYEGKEEAFDRIDWNLDVPSCLLNETTRERFRYLLDRDPPNANFADVGMDGEVMVA